MIEDKILVANMLRMLKKDFAAARTNRANFECGYVLELYATLVDDIAEQIEIFQKWNDTINGEMV